MTRKQAINLAISVLSWSGGANEAIEVLRSISDELPVRKWSKASVHDSFEQFMLDNGRVPYLSELGKKGLPNSVVIIHHTGMTYTELREQYMPGAIMFGSKGLSTAERELSVFREEFLRLKPTSCHEYNTRRTPGLLTWQRVCGLTDETTWLGLLKHLGLVSFPSKHPVRERLRVDFIVTEVGGINEFIERRKHYDEQIASLY